MASHTPYDLTTNFPTRTNLITNLYDVEGLTTGFGYYPPADSTFDSEAAFFLKLRREGFFTGYFPKKYYSPMQAEALYALSFVYETYTINGMEYMLRCEGLTSGDFRPSASQHGPGEAACDILQELSDHGYTAGTIETAIDAEAAMSDFNCLDGRCYGSGCLAPTWHVLELAVPVDTTDAAPATITQNYSSVGYDRTVWVFMMCGINGGEYVDSQHAHVRVSLDGGAFYSWPMIDRSWDGHMNYWNFFGTIALASGAAHTVTLTGWGITPGYTHANSYTCHIYLLDFKAACP